MSYKVRVYMGDIIKDIALSPSESLITIGSSDVDTLKVLCSDIMPAHLSFAYNNGVWTCTNKATGECKNVSDNDIFLLSKVNRVAATVYSDEFIPQRMKLKPNSKITIGREFDCMFHLPDRSVGRKHALVVVDELGVTIKDLNSLNGTYVNNRKVDEKSLKDGDVISIGKFNILYKNSELKLFVDNKEIEHKSNDKKVAPEYPIFNLSPRLRHQAPSEIIEIQAPPNIGNMPMVNWLSFLPMLATRSPYAAVFPLTSVFSTFLQKKKYKKAQEVRQEKYENYLADVKSKIDKNREDQFLSLEESNHETSQCFDIATKRQRTLWERTPEDDDFMKIRVGKGDIQTCFRIKFPDSVLKMYNDELEDQGEELGRGNQIIEGAPILCDLYHDLSVGIIGDRQKAISVARNMIVQLATTHSYKDVKIVTLFDKKESKDWEFTKWLPHSFNDSRDFRYVSNSVYTATTLDKVIDEELKGRKQTKDNHSERKEKNEPYYLFVVTNPEMIEQSEIENYLDDNQEGMGIGAIYVYDRINDLPKSCNIIVDIQSDRNEMFHKSNIGIKQCFEIDKFTAQKAETFARSLAPVRLAEKKSVADMPTSITFLEGYGVKRVEELPILDNWNSSNLADNVAVPLGIKANGEQFIFNIMDGSDFTRYHGPFGIVAGSPGSGKTEMMQSWMLSLATKFSPQELSFVIIDYSGASTITPFLNLPHLADKISNLDGKAHRNIIALYREMERRMAIFAKYNLEPQHIREYYRRNLHKTVGPMPILIIVVDEFAEIKKNLPEFVPVIESIFALGRKYGMWSVVATQKPGGVVTDKMFATSQFRWCCRVASSSDSKEMLKHTDAAFIKNAGRAFVQVGEDDIYEQIQSFWSGAPYMPDRAEKSNLDLPISLVDITGRKVKYEVYKNQKGKSEVKEIDAVVDYIRQIAKENSIPNSPKIWNEKLKDRIPLEDVVATERKDDLVVNVGLVDNPYEQSQYPLAIDFTNKGHCTVYGSPNSGKTTFLHTFIMSAAKTYTPEELNIYGIDFGSWSLNMFSPLPHVGGVAIDSEPEKLEKLVNMLKKELDTRKKAFALKFVSTIKAYNQENDKKLPYIVLMIDNLNTVINLYPDLMDFFEMVVQQGANYGIYIMATLSKEIYKISNGIKNNSIALQLKDKSEYASIVGNTNIVIQKQNYGTLEPENTPGRGLVRGNPIAHEFQTALPAYGEDENEILRNLKAEINKISESYSVCAKSIPVMPEVVTYKSVHCNGIALGLSAENIEAVSIDTELSHHCFIISEEYKNRGFNMAKVILKQFVEKENAKIVLFDNGTNIYSSLSDITYKTILDAKDFDMFIAELAQKLNERKNLSDLRDEETIVVVIDGYRAMYEAIDDSTAKRLSAIVRMGKGLKVFLVITEIAEKLSALCSIEPTIKNIVDEGIGLLVGGSFKTHNAFNGNLDYTAQNVPMNDSEAYIVQKSNAIKFKAIQDR